MNKDQFAEIIREHGWAVIRVGGDEVEPSFAYSVGFVRSFNHPEAIVFGLHVDKLHGIVNAIGNAVKAGTIFHPNQTASDVLEGYQCFFAPVDLRAARHYMGAATEFYGNDVPALQCVWPDREGRFPWDPDAPDEYRRLQPRLTADGG